MFNCTKAQTQMSYINVIYYSVPLGRGRGASPLPDCTFLTSAILMQFKKIYIFERWSEELIGWQSPSEPKLSVSGHRNLLFQLFFRCMQYLDKKFCLFASSSIECRRMRIYLKIHFTEKRWLLKEVEHQTECVFNPFPGTMERNLCQMNQKTSTRNTHLPYTQG